jgi:hypothetical protein
VMVRAAVINFTVQTEEKYVGDDVTQFEGYVGVIRLNGETIMRGEPMYDEAEAEDIAVGSFTQQLRGLLKDQDT